MRGTGGDGARRAMLAVAVVTTVRFTPEPGQAKLEVDGVYWGETPTTELTRLTAGKHVIVWKKAGYERWERTVHAELHRPTAGTARIAGLE